MLSEILNTVGVVLVIIIARILLSRIIKHKFGKLAGYQNLVSVLFAILTIPLLLYILNTWDILTRFSEVLAALGAFGVVFVLVFKDIWIANIFAGLSLIGDKHIHVGTEIEIRGKHGKITEITLTITKVVTDDGFLIIIPNMKFREEVMTIKNEG